MSRPHEKLIAALLRALTAFLLALGLGMPVLHGLGLGFLLGRYVLLCGVTALCCTALGLKRWLLPVALLLLALAQAGLLAAGRGFFADTVRLGRALLVTLRGEPLALSLYGDVLCAQLGVLIPLFCYALSTPDADAALAVTAVSGVLGAQWMLGLRHESLYMLPVLPALLLIYAATSGNQEEESARAPRPSLWLVPAAAALLALSALLAPQEGTKVPALAQAAERLREAINDRFFFQQERARYTLESDGWMPQGERRLGGRPQPSEQVIMQVETADTVYLRGTIQDTYTGAAWYDGISARRYYWSSLRYRGLRDEVTQTGYPLGAELPLRHVAVRYLAAGASTLFVPQRLRSLETGERMTLYFNRGSEVFITRNLQSGDAYSAEYVSMLATDSGMAALAEQHAHLDDPLYQAAVDAYTSLPGHIQQEVHDIAAAVTANCTTPWQKATALRDYLRQNYAYTLDVETPPSDVDFVAWFLLAERKGYCTYFASAMTVLCRMAGLPARYVEGYVVRPEAGGAATVRGTNAHAWTEVYLNGLGWVTFDATPGWGDQDRSGSAPPAPGELPSSPPGQQQPTPTPEAQETPAPTDQPPAALSDTPEPQDASPESDEETPTPAPTEPPEGGEPPQPPEKEKNQPLPWLWLLLLMALLLLAAWRIRATAPLRRAARARGEGAALGILWQAILECAEGLNLPMAEAETPIDFAVRAERALSVPLRSTALAVSALRYGRRRPSAAAAKQAREAYIALNERLPAGRKLRLALRRAARLNRKNRK